MIGVKVLIRIGSQSSETKNLNKKKKKLLLNVYVMLSLPGNPGKMVLEV